MSTYIMYNPKAHSGNGLEITKKIENIIGKEDLVYSDITAIRDLDAFVAGLKADDRLILSGGDGTLNFYINHTTEETKSHKMGYFATGTGNDFMRDVTEAKDNYAEDISEYLVDLPTVTVKGKDYLFLNGIGYGIDGYCCEVGDKLREKSDKPVNYTSIAIKGLLFHFKPRKAEITIDGKTSVVEHAWLVPSMNGRFYGGGMMAAPAQKRKSAEKKLSIMYFDTKSPLKALIVFPKIFSGEHIGQKIVGSAQGSVITVKFDKPCALQIDGDTYLDVSEYTARVAK